MPPLTSSRSNAPPGRRALAILLIVFMAGCASQRGSIDLADDARLNAFLEQVRDHVEDRQWPRLLDAAEEAHYQTQVEEMGMSEPQYAAELLGLHMVNNNIGGDPITWDHLGRIETLQFTTLVPTGDARWSARGVAILSDGSRMDVSADLMLGPNGYRLTGAVG